MRTSYIGLGSNLDDPDQKLRDAIAALDATDGLRLDRCSCHYTTTPVGGPAGQPAFLNAVARVETTLSPERLLDEMLRIERQLGRVRNERWSARTIDLDLLLYGEEVIDRRPKLIVPHPRIAWRRFVLEPLCELAPELVHPVIGWTIEQLLIHLQTAPGRVAVVRMPDDRAADYDDAGRLAQCIAAAVPSADVFVVENGSPVPDAKLTVLLDPDGSVPGCLTTQSISGPTFRIRSMGDPIELDDLITAVREICCFV